MFRRLTLFVFGFVLGLSGCHPKRVPIDQRFEIIHRGTYAYQRLNDGEFAVAAANQVELKRALKEIGCDKDYVCLIEPTGDLYSILVRQK